MKHGILAEQATALRSVDVHFSWIVHGQYAEAGMGFGEWHGPAVLAVNDEDYALPARQIEALQAGDVYSRESMGGQQATLMPMVLWDLQTAIGHSPYANQDTHCNLLEAIARCGIVGNIATERPIIHAALEEARRWQILSPFTYADGLAFLRGLTTAIADVPPDVYMKAGRRYEKAREFSMVQKLGGIACAMAKQPEPASRPARLLYVAGRDHRRGIERIMRTYDVPFTSHETSWHVHDQHPLVAMVRRLRHGRSVRQQLDYDFREQWFANIRAQGAEPLPEVTQL